MNRTEWWFLEDEVGPSITFSTSTHHAKPIILFVFANYKRRHIIHNNDQPKPTNSVYIIYYTCTLRGTYFRRSNATKVNTIYNAIEQNGHVPYTNQQGALTRKEGADCSSLAACDCAPSISEPRVLCTARHVTAESVSTLGLLPATLCALRPNRKQPLRRWWRSSSLSRTLAAAISQLSRAHGMTCRNRFCTNKSAGHKRIKSHLPNPKFWSASCARGSRWLPKKRRNICWLPNSCRCTYFSNYIL